MSLSTLKLKKSLFQSKLKSRNHVLNDCRSNRLEVFCKKGASKDFAKLTPVSESLF